LIRYSHVCTFQLRYQPEAKLRQIWARHPWYLSETKNSLTDYLDLAQVHKNIKRDTLEIATMRCLFLRT
jgi:G:T-mismatch repair DNA endonuclease (very short patch repair protein)